MEQLNYLRYLLAFAIVMGLICLMGWAGKKFGWAQLGIKMASPQNKRLQVISMQSIDTRNRLVLIRRDNTEHLLAVGPEQITVIETNITPPPSTVSTQETKA